MPRPKRRQGGKTKKKGKKNKDKHQSHKNKNMNGNANAYSSKIVNEIRMMIANNDGESAMKKINTIDEHLTKQNKTLPLILNSLKCVILAQYEEHDALKLVFDEIVNHMKSSHYQWDIESLNCLQNACTRCGQIDYLMTFLESAFNCNTPGVKNTEEISRSLYVAYFVNAQYDKLSQLSQKMKRTFKHNSDEYTMWTIIGPLIKIVLNHFHCKYKEIDVEKLSTQLNQTEDTILKLQQFQFERQFMNNTKEFMCKLFIIYYKILRLRNEWKKLSECIDKHKSNWNDQNKLKLWKLECLVNLNEYDAVDHLCASLLFEPQSLFVDDYEIWSHWIDAQLVNESNKHKLVQQIQAIQMNSAYDKLRAPYLAEIEFNHRLRCAKMDNAKPEDDYKLILKYVHTFASRYSCCFEDIKKYLRYEADEAVSLLGAIQQMNPDPDLKSQICCYQIELYLGLWMEEDEKELIKRVRDLYHKWRQSELETEADPLLLIAVHILLYLAHKDKNKTLHFVLNAIFLLELGIVRSPSSFELKLYLLRLYCHPCVGNILGAFKQFESMKIRGVQYDSLCHILFHDASRYGFISKTQFFDHAMEEHRREFNIANLARSPECFEFNNYDKAIEFAEFNYVMQQSEMYLICQAESIVSRVLNYYYQKHNDKYNIIDYFEAFVLPRHAYLKQLLGHDEEYKAQEDEWIDLNDYTSIPIYINQSKPIYHDHYHPLLVCPAVSTLSCKTSSNKVLKESHTKLLLAFVGMLYSSNQNQLQPQQLMHFWNLLKALQFVRGDIVNDMPTLLSLCDGDNDHWLLVFCLHSLGTQLLVEHDTDNNEAFTANLSLICARFDVFSDDLQRMLCSQVNQQSKYGLNGVHLQRIWRYISILCLTATSLFRHWITQTQTQTDLNKIIENQYQFVSKRMDKLKRALSDMVEGIQSEYKIIDIDCEQKELDKILKHHDVNELSLHQSLINLDEQNKTTLRDIKIALVNINNAVNRNTTHILKQQIQILKQLRSPM